MTKHLVDAYAPREIAARVRDVGVQKAELNLASLFALAILAGAFIALGGCWFRGKLRDPTARGRGDV